MVFKAVAVDHLMVNNFSDHHYVRSEGGQHPNMQQTFLAEVLRVEGLRLEIQILALVVPLVSNICPEGLAVWLDVVRLRNAQSRSAADVVSREVFWVVVSSKGRKSFAWFGLVGLSVLVRVGIAKRAWVCLVEGVESVIIPPIVGLGVMTTAERVARRSEQQGKSSFSQ